MPTLDDSHLLSVTSLILFVHIYLHVHGDVLNQIQILQKSAVNTYTDVGMRQLRGSPGWGVELQEVEVGCRDGGVLRAVGKCHASFFF